MWATPRFIVCVNVCLCGEERRPTGKSAQQGTMPQMQPEMRLAYSADMFVICLFASFLLPKNQRERESEK